MFQKYNAVMRAKTTPHKGKVPQIMLDRFEETCKGNCYTTTIWVINSGSTRSR